MAGIETSRDFNEEPEASNKRPGRCHGVVDAAGISRRALRRGATSRQHRRRQGVDGGRRPEGTPMMPSHLLSASHGRSIAAAQLKREAPTEES